LFWGDRCDRYDWNFALSYMVVAAIVASATAWVTRRGRKL